jgi:hypothetical protein
MKCPAEVEEEFNYGITRSRHGSAEKQEWSGTLRPSIVLWDERKQDLTAVQRERHERQVLGLVIGFIEWELEEQQVVDLRRAVKRPRLQKPARRRIAGSRAAKKMLY